MSLIPANYSHTHDIYSHIRQVRCVRWFRCMATDLTSERACNVHDWQQWIPVKWVNCYCVLYIDFRCRIQHCMNKTHARWVRFLIFAWISMSFSKFIAHWCVGQTSTGMTSKQALTWQKKNKHEYQQSTTNKQALTWPTNDHCHGQQKSNGTTNKQALTWSTNKHSYGQQQALTLTANKHSYGQQNKHWHCQQTNTGITNKQALTPVWPTNKHSDGQQTSTHMTNKTTGTLFDQQTSTDDQRKSNTLTINKQSVARGFYIN